MALLREPARDHAPVDRAVALFLGGGRHRGLEGCGPSSSVYKFAPRLELTSAAKGSKKAGARRPLGSAETSYSLPQHLRMGDARILLGLNRTRDLSKKVRDIKILDSWHAVFRVFWGVLS